MRVTERDQPLAEATTHSLDALRFFTIAKNHVKLGNYESPIPFLKKAIEAAILNGEIENTHDAARSYLDKIISEYQAEINNLKN